MNQPSFTRDQIIPSSVASKQFGMVRKQAQEQPQFISDNGKVSTVVMSYGQYEMMYRHVLELEEREETRIVGDRLDRLEKHPETAIPWRSVRRTVLTK